MCEGFVNNAQPKKEEIGGRWMRPNYANLKSQCSVKMANKIKNREAVEYCNDQDIIDIVSEEMEQVKLKDVDKDGKIAIIPKDKVKDLIGRSPDDWDSIMMRYWFAMEKEFFVV